MFGRRLGRVDVSVPAALRLLKARISLPGRILSANREFAKLALELEPDVLHAHDLNTIPAALIVNQLTGIPVIYDSHELFLERNLGSGSRRIDQAVWGVVERRGIGHCAAVISVSESICRTLERQYGLERVELVRNVQRYVPPPEGESSRLQDSLRLPSSTDIGIYAGGIMRHRGLEALVDSAAHLERSVFVIMGYATDESYLDSLRERAAKRGVLGRTLFFHPAVPSEEVVPMVSSAKLGLVPTENICLSYYYEASNKIFHCMMAGVPLAMSDHPEKRLLVERHGIGVLFDETGPPERIAAQVEDFLDDRDRYEDAKRSCLEAARLLNWEHEEQTIRRIYRQLGALEEASPPERSLLPV